MNHKTPLTDTRNAVKKKESIWVSMRYVQLQACSRICDWQFQFPGKRLTFPFTW